MKNVFTLFAASLLFTSAHAQCTFTPTITGDTMLCPGTGGELTTQVYDSYQWYRRGFSDTVAQLIPNATAQVLTVNHFDDSGVYFSVEVTDSGCTEMSAEKLVDGWAFLPPAVMTEGDFTTGNDGETVICNGDTAFFTLMQPYTTAITWFKDGDEIEGENSSTIAVTEAGNYSVEGAPAECPFSIEQIGVDLVVQVINCSTGIEQPLEILLQCEWNAADGMVHIRNIPDGVRKIDVEVYALDGKVIKKETLHPEGAAAQVKLGSIASGVYVCLIQVGKEIAVKKVTVR